MAEKPTIFLVRHAIWRIPRRTRPRFPRPVAPRTPTEAQDSPVQMPRPRTPKGAATGDLGGHHRGHPPTVKVGSAVFYQVQETFFFFLLLSCIPALARALPHVMYALEGQWGAAGPGATTGEGDLGGGGWGSSP